MLARTPKTALYLAKPKPAPRKINKDRRRHLVETVAAILKTGEPTHFAHEASCRHGIRSGLCLDGWGWQEADAAATEIVAAALNRIGARRPTWKEGQPEYTQEGFAPILRTRCIRCGGSLPEGHTKFCSHLCSSAHKQIRYRRDNEDAVQARQAAHDATWRDKQPERQCAGCGIMFRPKRQRSTKHKGLFCSRECYGRNQNRRRA